MENNLLELETKKGTHLLFDNYSGIVIEKKKYTKYLLEHIDDDKKELIEKLKKLNMYVKNEFEREYNYINLLRENGYLVARKFKKVYRYPEENLFKGFSSHLILITTEDCNLRCKYCVYSDCYQNKKAYSSKYMDIETALKAVDLFKNMHEKKVIKGYKDLPKINFYGGEPLLNYHLIKSVVKYVKKISFKNVQYLITTNGTVMNDEMIDFLAKYNFIVSFSLDGDKFNHDRNRVQKNGEKTHEKIIRNIIKFYDKLKYYNRDSIINIICCFDDYTNMEKVTSYFEKLKKRINNLNVIFNKVYEVDTTYYDYCKKRYKENPYGITEKTNKETTQKLFEKYYLKEINEGIPDSIKSLFKSYYLLKNRKKGIMDFYQGNACTIGDKICISPDEKIYICEKANQEMEIGDLARGLDLKKIELIYKKYYKIRESHCFECPIVRLCDVCYVHFINKNNLQFNKNFCERRKNTYIQGLKTLYSLLEENKYIFDLSQED